MTRPAMATVLPQCVCGGAYISAFPQLVLLVSQFVHLLHALMVFPAGEGEGRRRTVNNAENAKHVSSTRYIHACVVSELWSTQKPVY